MIKFDDGTEITWEEAAVMIEEEGSIYQTEDFGNGFGRCAVGVLIDWAPPYHVGSHGYINYPHEIIHAGEEFKGTAEERCTFMAGWMRAQGDLESRELEGKHD